MFLYIELNATQKQKKYVQAPVFLEKDGTSRRPFLNTTTCFPSLGPSQQKT